MSNAEPQNIAVLAGDGVGPEVTAATLEVVEAVTRAVGVQANLRRAPVGWESYRSQGSTMPDETIAVLKECPGWIVGPTAAGEYPADDPINGHPSGYMRRNFSLFANIRPAHAWPHLPALVPELKTTIFRENTEGMYPDRNLYRGYGEFMPTADVAIALRVITRAACDRFAKMTFEYARANGHGTLVVVHKRTALKQTDGLFCEAFAQLESSFPEIAVEYMRIDTFSSSLPAEPGRFGLVATTNLFGDIMSDQASGLVGGIGLAPSLNAGNEYAMAQAVHGTAADIAGKGLVNPAALILSAGMMLEWLGRRERAQHREESAQAWERAGTLISEAVSSAIADGTRTRDLGGSASTAEFGSAVARAAETLATAGS
jgi:3-isopropylmalate dehydrogenase